MGKEGHRLTYSLGAMGLRMANFIIIMGRYQILSWDHMSHFVELILSEGHELFRDQTDDVLDCMCKNKITARCLGITPASTQPYGIFLDTPRDSTSLDSVL